MYNSLCQHCGKLRINLHVAPSSALLTLTVHDPQKLWPQELQSCCSEIQQLLLLCYVCKHTQIIPFSSVILQMTHCILNKTLQLNGVSVCKNIIENYKLIGKHTCSGNPLNWSTLAAKIFSPYSS